MDVGGATDDLDGGGGADGLGGGGGVSRFKEVSGDGTGVNLAEMEMGAFNRFGGDDFDDVGFLVLRGEVFNAFHLHEAGANQLNELLVGEVGGDAGDVLFDVL